MSKAFLNTTTITSSKCCQYMLRSLIKMLSIHAWIIDWGKSINTIYKYNLSGRVVSAAANSNQGNSMQQWLLGSTYSMTCTVKPSLSTSTWCTVYFSCKIIENNRPKFLEMKWKCDLVSEIFSEFALKNHNWSFIDLRSISDRSYLVGSLLCLNLSTLLSDHHEYLVFAL